MINQVCFHSCGISIILLVSDLDLESIDPVLERIGSAELGRFALNCEDHVGEDNSSYVEG